MVARPLSDFDPAGERFAVALPEGSVAGWRFQNSGAPRLLFCHANGFCASAYRKMLSLLAPRFDVFAIDLRGHGRTSLPADPRKLRDWRVYAGDIAAVLDHPSMQGGTWILAGHSCGAASAALAAEGRTDVARLALIEPVAPPPALALIASTPLWPVLAGRMPLARNARARRSRWTDREAARLSYSRKALFSAWAPGALEDYLKDGLREEGGEAVLACAPEWEAASFMAQAHDFWGAIARAPGPVRVLAADHPGSTLFAGAARRFARLGAEVTMQRGAGHLLPMEAPEAAAAFLGQSS